ncbi:hypothetical protein F8388_017745 [Cannabis sativa]|uniref:Uncharacterized protein n=1 Tax=Cannabis sativa TaxID=3483 RepID=A0A7J6HIC5_CANSA|nr:hypothetical protein F8388_017745 [Cannabis sativa]
MSFWVTENINRRVYVRCGLALVLANTEDSGEELIADSHLIPATMVGQINGDKIKQGKIKTFDDLASGEKSTPFIHGAGHVDPNKALNPGLVYDLDVNDYVAFLCLLGMILSVYQYMLKHPLALIFVKRHLTKLGL